MFNTLNNLVKHIIIVKFLRGLLGLNVFLKKVILYRLANSLVIISVLRLSVKLYVIKLKLFAFVSIMLNLICFWLVL
jgi:hypothetical protein